MTKFGYTMMCEQSRPDQLVRDLQRAEEAGFDFSVISDHYQPWLSSQGHSGYAWSILGAAAQATERIPLMTFVTCPILRYHPAVVAQKAATVQILSGNRFRLGLGSGENLNEHVVGGAWPPADIRHQMFVEALEIIRRLFDGETVTFRGEHLEAENAKLWDLPPDPPKIGCAVSGPRSCELAGRHADAMIAVQPDADLGDRFDKAGGAGKPRIGQIGLSYDRDEAAATKRAHEQFRWFTGGWDVMAELPAPQHFASASQFVREEDVSGQIPCGPDVEAHVAGVKKFVDAGFTHVAVVQIGGDTQDMFFDWAEKELLPELRALG
jgi:G6PDH family F420-dependent oxidoreductase